MLLLFTLVTLLHNQRIGNALVMALETKLYMSRSGGIVVMLVMMDEARGGSGGNGVGGSGGGRRRL